MAISFRGKRVDMVSLAKRNEKRIALGNAHMNGRGDIVRHGEVVKTREEQIADWYASHKTTTTVQNMKEEVSSESLNTKPTKASKTQKPDTKDVEKSVKSETVLETKTPKYENITEEEITELEEATHD